MATNNIINTPLPVSFAKGGTGVASPAIHGIVVAQGSDPVATKVLTNGQLLIGSTGADPVAATLTAGSNVTITPGAGTISIASSATGGGMVWSSITTSTKTMVANEGYVSNFSGGVGYTLPSSCTLGDIFEITGPYPYAINQLDGQSIRVGEVTTTVGINGFVSSNNSGDTVRLVCSDATSGAERFIIISGVGDFLIN